MSERRTGGFIDQMRHGSDIRLLWTKPGSRANRLAVTAADILFPMTWRMASASIQNEHNPHMSPKDVLQERKFRHTFMAATLGADILANLITVVALTHGAPIAGLGTKAGEYVVGRVGFKPNSR